jgi:hypothetical protein
MVLRDLRVMEHAGRARIRRDEGMSHRDSSRVRLCSACRGDYEDPDASTADDEAVEPEDNEGGNERRIERFPAQHGVMV